MENQKILVIITTNTDHRNSGLREQQEKGKIKPVDYGILKAFWDKRSSSPFILKYGPVEMYNDNDMYIQRTLSLAKDHYPDLPVILINSGAESKFNSEFFVELMKSVGFLGDQEKNGTPDLFYFSRQSDICGSKIVSGISNTGINIVRPIKPLGLSQEITAVGLKPKCRDMILERYQSQLSEGNSQLSIDQWISDQVSQGKMTAYAADHNLIYFPSRDQYGNIVGDGGGSSGSSDSSGSSGSDFVCQKNGATDPVIPIYGVCGSSNYSQPTILPFLIFVCVIIVAIVIAYILYKVGPNPGRLNKGMSGI